MANEIDFCMLTPMMRWLFCQVEIGYFLYLPADNVQIHYCSKLLWSTVSSVVTGTKTSKTLISKNLNDCELNSIRKGMKDRSHSSIFFFLEIILNNLMELKKRTMACCWCYIFRQRYSLYIFLSFSIIIPFRNVFRAYFPFDCLLSYSFYFSQFFF